MSVKEWLGKVGLDIKKNLPSILTGTGIANMLLGTCLAIKATPRAMQKIEEKKKEEGHEHLTAVQTLQATWRCYIWAAAAELGGVTCIVAGLNESNKRQAALSLIANSAEISLREFKEYRKYVQEQLGEKKEREIHAQAVNQTVERAPMPADMANKEAIEGVAPKPICFDKWSGRYYYVDYDTVASAVNKLNQKMYANLEGYVSLNDFYIEIGVPVIESGDRVGWNTETGLIEIPDKDMLDYAGTPNNWPCWVLEFVNPPQYEYKFFRKH